MLQFSALKTINRHIVLVLSTILISFYFGHEWRQLEISTNERSSLQIQINVVNFAFLMFSEVKQRFKVVFFSLKNFRALKLFSDKQTDIQTNKPDPGIATNTQSLRVVIKTLYLLYLSCHSKIYLNLVIKTLPDKPAVVNKHLNFWTRYLQTDRVDQVWSAFQTEIFMWIKIALFKNTCHQTFIGSCLFIEFYTIL